jgi:ABC-type Na+ transport system ATPase subunit NatA
MFNDDQSQRICSAPAVAMSNAREVAFMRGPCPRGKAKVSFEQHYRIQDSKIFTKVLDEATSSIDESTNEILQEMLRTNFSNKTLITIAHWLQTTMDDDTIAVLNEAKVVEMEADTFHGSLV